MNKNNKNYNNEKIGLFIYSKTISKFWENINSISDLMT